MNESRRSFLNDLLDTATPSGFEAAGQRRWIEYVSTFADEVQTDDYGNAIAILEGDENGPTVALTGHGDEIGFMVRNITDDGMIGLTPIGGSDRTVSKGQHVEIHTDSGPIAGVVGQAAIHLRDGGEESISDINEQYVDIGATDAEEAGEVVERGDPITFRQTVSELSNGRIAARGLDNRVGIWAAAEGLRRAADADPEATVCAVSTVQEEVGLQGAKMVAFNLTPDVVVATDVTHATDSPVAPATSANGVALGEGPVVARGSANHTAVISAAREAASNADIDIQLAASGTRTGTDADAFYTARGGVPSLNLGIPNRYMHTPVEVVELADLNATADLLAAFATEAGNRSFGPDF